YTRIEPEIAERIRLADSVAASSCFPGAFEPIAWPSDFGFPSGEPTPLMDGGIFDNSGIESVLLIRDRTEIDAILVCDADATSGPLYRDPAIKGGGWLRVWMLLVLLAIVCGAAVFAAFQSTQLLPAIFSGAVALA